MFLIFCNKNWTTAATYSRSNELYIKTHKHSILQIHTFCSSLLQINAYIHTRVFNCEQAMTDSRILLHRDEYKQHDCVKARNHMLLDFLIFRETVTCIFEKTLKGRNITLNLVATTRGGLKLCGGPGWNLQKGLFYSYETVVNREKINERTEVFVLLKQKKLEHKKTNRQLIWTSQYERNSLMVISSLHCLLETWNHIDKFSQNTGGMF